jgi:hypothetical protein
MSGDVDVTESEMLLPCPFCGRSEARLDWDEDEKYGRYGFRVHCDVDLVYVDGKMECGCMVYPETRRYYSPEEAIAAWNRRAAHQPSVHHKAWWYRPGSEAEKYFKTATPIIEASIPGLREVDWGALVGAAMTPEPPETSGEGGNKA